MSIALAPAATGPLYRQLYETLREAILAGSLSPGQQLAPTRVLAGQLDVSRNTVNAAYEMLLAEGFINARQGAGYFVAELVPETAAPIALGERPASTSRGVSHRGDILARRSRQVPAIDNPAFQRGYPALDAFPFRQWQQHVERHLKPPDSFELMQYQDDGGLAPLKRALKDYLWLSRGVRCREGQIIIVTGGQAALDLISRLLVDEGDSVAIEEPGYLGARDALAAAGARLVPVPVDRDGMDVDRLADGDSRLAYITPSYQFPLGVTLSASRRVQMLRWAEAADAYIIEDDYDSEFRYRGRPLSSLQGIDEGSRVIYMGTFSKVMFPALRLGYIVAPEHLAAAFKSSLRKTGQDAPLLMQAAMADFISSSQFASHIRRMRTLYGKRQKRFVELGREHLSRWLAIEPTDAGMQLACPFTRPIDEVRALRFATAQRIDIGMLSDYYLTGCHAPGLFLGYAGIAEGEMEAGILTLRDVLAQAEN